MPNGGSYYSLTITVKGASTSAYYGLTPTSNLVISQGGATLYPSEVSATMVTIDPQMLQIQAAAGTFTAGGTIVTADKVIAGTMSINPPVDVAVTVTAYGNAGEIGQKVVDPGISDAAFSFPVDGSEGIAPADAVAELRKRLAG
jgi:hypothetical protein